MRGGEQRPAGLIPPALFPVNGISIAISSRGRSPYTRIDVNFRPAKRTEAGG